MRIIIIFMILVSNSSLAYAQPYLGIAKEDIIRRARQQAESSNPPMNSSHMQAHAVYLPDENVWVVDFIDTASKVDDSDYMLKVEATSGKEPVLLKGSLKQRYKSYFETAEE